MRDRTESDAGEADRAEPERSARALGALTAATLDAFFMKDTEGRFLACNLAAAQAIGRPVSEIIGRLDSELFPPGVARKLRADEQAIIDSGRARSYEEVVPYAGLDRTWITTKAPFRDASGAIAGIVGSSHDISVRKQIEQALRQSNAVLEAVVEGTTDAVFVKDREGRMLLANEALARLTGKPSREIIGQDDTAIFPPEVARRFQEDDRRIMQTGETVTYEETIGQLEPQTFLTTKGAWRDAEGRVVGVFGIARNISERKRAEAEILRALAAEREARQQADDARRDAERAARRLSDLQAILEATLAPLDLDTLLLRVTGRIATAFEVDTVAVLLLDAERRELVVRAAIGLDEAIRQGLRFSVERGVAGQIMREDRPIQVEDVSAVELASPILRERGVRSLLGVPLRVGERVIGVVHMGKLTPHRFDQEDVRFFELIADRIAIAIERNRMFEEVQRARAAAEAAEQALRAATLEREAANERLAHQLELTRAISANLGEGVATLDRDGRMTFLNPAGERILGWTQAELLGRPLHDVIHFQRADGVPVAARDCPQLAVLGTGMPLRNEDDVFTRKDGSMVPVSVMTAPVRRGDQVDGIVFSFYDISERKRAEQAARFLAAASATLASSLELDVMLERFARLAVPELADWCAIDLVENGALRRAALAHAEPERAALARELGELPVSVVEASHPLQSVLGSGQAKLGRDPGELARAMVLPPTASSELRRLGCGGHLIIPLLVRERIVGACTLLAAPSVRFDETDLTHALELGRRVAIAIDNARLYQEAEQASRAREELLAVVSHDLRNPLSAIVASSEGLDRILPAGEVGDRLRRYVATIRRSGDRMDRLIRDLLDAARIEAGRFAVRRWHYPLEPLIQEILELQAPIAEQKSIRLERRVAAGLGDVSCDRDQILRVLSNLVGNAIQHTPRQGRITLSADALGGMLRLGVSDSGPGIPSDQIEHLFDRYWQGRRASLGGAGLGLFISRGIVAAHGGQLWVESQVGQGSSFWFTLPRADALARRPEAQRGHAVARSR
jgi:PAS domain S-box-containing protein